jgi:hypothetical protein
MGRDWRGRGDSTPAVLVVVGYQPPTSTATTTRSTTTTTTATTTLLKHAQWLWKLQVHHDRRFESRC